MSLWFVIVSMVAAVNPPRIVTAMAATPASDRQRPLWAGVTLASVGLVALAALGSNVLEVLELTDETWRIAAGAVAVLAGARHLAFRPAGPVPQVGTWGHGLAPIAFPLILVPELVLLSILYGATETLGDTCLGLAVGMVALVVWSRGDDGVVTRGSARLLAALLVAAGVGLLVAGIRDV